MGPMQRAHRMRRSSCARHVGGIVGDSGRLCWALASAQELGVLQVQPLEPGAVMVLDTCGQASAWAVGADLASGMLLRSSAAGAARSLWRVRVLGSDLASVHVCACLCVYVCV